jgi:nitroreductase
VDADTAIRARRTHKQFGTTPVDDATLRELLDLARLAPNHRLTEPWRFRVLGPETRARLDELVGEKEAAKLGRAPTLVLVTARLSHEPEAAEEDLHATAAAVQTILLAATARGLASYWRTPAAFRSDEVRTLLAVEPSERFVALVHLGPPAGDPPAKERLPVDSIARWLP